MSDGQHGGLAAQDSADIAAVADELYGRSWRGDCGGLFTGFNSPAHLLLGIGLVLQTSRLKNAAHTQHRHRYAASSGDFHV